MKIFKEVMAILCNPIGTFLLGFATYDLFTGDYKTAAWVLFATSIVFLVGYSVEYLSKEDFKR